MSQRETILDEEVLVAVEACLVERTRGAFDQALWLVAHHQLDQAVRDKILAAKQRAITEASGHYLGTADYMRPAGTTDRDLFTGGILR